MYENCVSFTGHRSAPFSLSKSLDNVIEQLYQQGYTTFLSGMALGFDMLAAEAVLRAKANHHDIKLVAVLPMPEQAARFSKESKIRHETILQQADQKIITSQSFTNYGVYHIRNRYLVEHCSILVSYYDGTPGGTQKTIEFARKIGRKIINITLE